MRAARLSADLNLGDQMAEPCRLMMTDEFRLNTSSKSHKQTQDDAQRLTVIVADPTSAHWIKLRLSTVR